MKPILIPLILIVALLAACGPAPTPAPTVDVDATISAISQEMVAGTLTAQPTDTPLPTDTPTPIPPTATPLPTETVTPTMTLTPEPFFGTLAPAGVHGTNKDAVFRIENNTHETLIVTIYGVSKPGDKPVYYSYKVTASFNFFIVWGSFNYTVQVGDKRTFTGTVGVNNDDKTTMRVFNDKVVIVGP